MLIKLEPRYLKIVKKILHQNVPDRTVLVFGSRITEQYKPHSDLDLCIMGTVPLTLSELAHLREAFAESDLPIRVDIVDWMTTDAAFQAIIKKKSCAN